MKITEHFNSIKVKRPIFIFFISWIICLFMIAAIEPAGTKLFGKKILPSWDDYVPYAVKNAFTRLTTKPAETKKQTSGEVKKNNLYAGENFKHIEHLFKKLSDLESKGGTVRIFHTGDSQLMAENFAGTLKRNFQRDFGDGGRGIVNTRQTIYSKLTGHENLTSENDFYLRDVYTYQNNPDSTNKDYMGFTAQSSVPRDASASTVHKAPENVAPWKSVDVYVRAPMKLQESPAKYVVNIEYSGTSQTKEIELKEDKFGKVHFDLPGVKSVSINFKGTKSPMPFVDGINFESGRGVAYTTSVCTGHEITWLGWIPQNHLAEGFQAYGPDVVLYNFGANEAYRIRNFSNYTRETLIREMKDILTRMKKNLPNTDIILIGSMEGLMKTPNGLITIKEQQEVRDMQVQLAKELGLCYYDWYNSAGGEGHMMKFIEAGLATKDYVHLSKKGAEYMGNIVYNDIYNSYQEYRGHREKIVKQEKAAIEEKKDEIIKFNSASFAWFFIAVLFILNLIVKFPALRVFFLLVASYLFYASEMLWPLALIFVSAVLDYSCGIAISWKRSIGERGTAFLVLSLILNLGVLFMFKYFDFAAGIANTYIGAQIPYLHLGLPVAISFYTFETVSYSIDVWRGEIQPEKNFFKFALFLSFFPHLAAGPIVRARQFLPGIQNGRHFQVTSEKVSLGVFLVLCGLMKKMGADYIAVNFIDRVFASPDTFSSLEVLVSMWGYGVQIYCDFSGYSDLAIGSAIFLGFQLPENFRRPFQAVSVTEFWSRWHITLSTWFRDYVYISLGGNKRWIYFNLIATMVLCGIWHGAGIQYVLFGFYYGLFLSIERATGYSKLENKSKSIRWLRIIITFQIMTIGWTIFRSRSWGEFVAMFKQLSTLTTSVSNIAPTVIIPMLVFFIWHLTPLAWKEKLKEIFHNSGPLLQGGFASLVTIFLYNIAISDVIPFIYFRF